MEWIISADMVGTSKVTDADLEELVESLKPFGGALGLDEDRLRWHATFAVDAPAPTPADAAQFAQSVLAGLLVGTGARVIALEVMEAAEADRRLEERNFPELLGIGEIAELLGVTRQRASTLQTSAGFPDPVARLKSGPVWTEPSVRNFAATWQRKGGRPRKVTELPKSDPAIAEAFSAAGSAATASMRRRAR